MFLCKVIVGLPTKLYFFLPRSTKQPMGIINDARRKHRAGMQFVVSKYCFGSLLTDKCNEMSQFYKIPAATITTSTQLCVKRFVENENKFAHDVMERLPTYSVVRTLKRSGSGVYEKQEFSLDTCRHHLQKDWSRESPSDICQAFNGISKYVSNTNVLISENIFTELCYWVTKNAPAYSTSELDMILSSLTLWPETDSVNSRNFVSIWEALDRECKRRVEKWNIETLLHFADLWYTLHLAKLSRYMVKCIKVLGRQHRSLSPSQLVQSVFYVRICQKQELVSMYEFERCISMCVDKLSLNEIAIVAMSFFKTESKIKSPHLLGQIMKRFTDEVDTVNEIALAAVLKIIRYSAHIGLNDQLHYLFSKLLPNINKLSLLACVHITMSAASMQIFHEELMKVTSQRFANSVRSLRLKDMDQILFTLTSFDYSPKTIPCIYEQIVNELHDHQREEEIKRYPHSLAACLSHLTLRSTYSKELTNKVLDQGFIQDVNEKSYKRMCQPILSLDTSIGIECPNYVGNRLSTQLRHQLCKEVMCHKLTETNKKLSFNAVCLLKCAESLKSILGGPKYIYLGNILPNFQRPDIVFGLIKGDSAVEIPTEFRTLPLGTVKDPPIVGSGVEWHCLVFGSKNNYAQPSTRPMASLTAKMRQLGILGYIPLLVPFYEWPNIPIQQKQYLQDKIRFQC